MSINMQTEMFVGNWTKKTKLVTRRVDEADMTTDSRGRDVQSSRSRFTRGRNLKRKNLELGCPVLNHELRYLCSLLEYRQSTTGLQVTGGGQSHSESFTESLERKMTVLKINGGVTDDETCQYRWKMDYYNIIIMIFVFYIFSFRFLRKIWTR